MIDLARVRIVEKSLFAEPRYYDSEKPPVHRLARPPRPIRKGKPQKHVVSIRQQYELERLHKHHVSVAKAARLACVSRAAVAEFYEWCGHRKGHADRDENEFFGEIPVPRDIRIACPTPGCRAVQTWYVPSPGGGSLPCRACRIREYVRQKRQGDKVTR